MAQSKINYWKLGVIAGVAVALFLFGRSCGIRGVLKSTGADTVIYRDTTILRYQPYPVYTHYDTTIYRPVVIRSTDTLHWIDPVDTAAILGDYYATRYYSDTQALKRGVVVIQDSVTQNRIIARRLAVTGVDSTITKTVVLTPPRRLVGYLDLAGMGGRHDFGASAGFSLKLPSDRVYGAGVSYLWNGKIMYYGRVSVPIRLKR